MKKNIPKWTNIEIKEENIYISESAQIVRSIIWTSMENLDLDDFRKYELELRQGKIDNGGKGNKEKKCMII